MRVIAACNANLPDYVAQGRFRKDLYYRLSTFPVHIPPLRSAPAISLLWPTPSWTTSPRKLHRSFSLTGDAVSRLQAPRLARQCPGAAQRAGVLRLPLSSGIITEESLPDSLPHDPQSAPLLTLAQRTRAFEKREISRLLEQNGSSLEGKKKTAAQLGISLASLYNKLKASEI
ncbi:MAG: sigma 54-interacting transcriptional regulator [Intestinimonas sp.]